MPTKVHLVKVMVFPVLMYGYEIWTIKKAEHQRIDVFELWYWRRLLRVPWTARRYNQSILKISPWVFIGRTDVEAETPILWPPDAKSWHLKRLWCWEILEAGGEEMTEDEMVGWHHWLNGHESEQAPGVGDGQGSLVCYRPWGHKESDITEWLKSNSWDLFNSRDGKRLKSRHFGAYIIYKLIN